jgi:phosphotransferase system  glucose/maltose/N-acetylglucosamine-specific IIC component
MDPHETIYRYNALSRGILGGLFVGILASAVNLLFDYLYRHFTHYQISEFVNINSIIFFTIPSLVAAGIAYAIIRKNVKSGLLVYIIISIVITAVVAFIPLGPNMLPNGQAMPSAARGLTMGIEIITGLMGAFALPYFAEHEKIWSDDKRDQYS